MCASLKCDICDYTNNIPSYSYGNQIITTQHPFLTFWKKKIQAMYNDQCVAEEIFCLNALIPQTTGTIIKIFILLDTPFIKEGYSSLIL